MAKKASKQHTFVWEGTDRRGNRIKGELHANTLALAKADLRRQGVSPIKVKKKSSSLFLAGGRKKKITSKDITVFSRQLATMMSAGVPLVQAFEIIAKGNEHPGVRDMVMAVKADIEGGASLSEALRKHPRQFDTLFCSLVYAGEQAGILENLLNKIALYKEKTETIKSKVRKALFYPTAVIIVAILVSIALLLFVVPEFEKMFQNFGADLPAPTRMVIFISEILQEYWWAALGVAILVGMSLKKAKQDSKAFNFFLDRMVLRIPVFGELVRKAIIARFARTLSTMFAAGVPLVEALESVAGAAGNTVYAKGIMKMREDVATGQQLQMAMQQSKLFPSMSVQMVAIGEESGSLDAMLGKVADFYEQEVDEAVDGISSLIEPMIMVVLGTIIGGLVISMYLPIFKMGQVL